MTCLADEHDTRADDITQDVLDIVAVVLGGEPIRLDNAGRAQALAAMNALGYSAAYMGEQLRMSARSAAALASELNVPLTRSRHFVDMRAVEFVLQGTPMRLRGNDMTAALRQLAERGATPDECARLLRTERRTIDKHAAANGIQLAANPDRGCWWNHYYNTAPAAGTDT